MWNARRDFTFHTRSGLGCLFITLTHARRAGVAERDETSGQGRSQTRSRAPCARYAASGRASSVAVQRRDRRGCSHRPALIDRHATAAGRLPARHPPELEDGVTSAGFSELEPELAAPAPIVRAQALDRP